MVFDPLINSLKNPTIKQIYLMLFLFVALVATSVLSLQTGLANISFKEIIGILFNSPSEAIYTQIIWHLRLPRILVAILSGAMFAISGALLQSVIKNSLAAPDIIGVNAGASLVIVFLMILAPSSPPWLLTWGAFGGAWVGFGIVYLLALKNGSVTPLRLTLIGVAVATGLGSAQRMVILKSNEGIGNIVSFLSGSVYGADMTRFFTLLPWALILIPLSFVYAHKADILALGDLTSTSLGERTNLTRSILLTISVGLASVAVIGGGLLGFVGLIAPHIAKLLVGSRHKRVLPIAALMGAFLVVFADMLGRILAPPIEVPAGILTTLLGVPYFIWLMRRAKTI